ncbi:MULTISPECIES: DUF1259 domain-containing protein [Kitasatospora]|uniref:DUF1259 domain-containing protein n=1 Tax=Kitasatospora cathayae TaxID=3004092 RepID=A0ABY7QC23_9ACTN|nr:DUF1259 domain-containing protein [Kitasatospora sp. HUAS 3-15]WBP90147.1 DUF1259 domain-containing protein [Kitasatospora sp. HUAS 3-15]
MKTEDANPGNPVPPAVPRRPLLAAAGLIPVLAGLAGDAAMRSAAAHGSGGMGSAPNPVTTSEADWGDIARALGRPGNLIRRTYHHTPFPRHDLHVVSRGVTITPGLALGSHASFARYDDGSTLMMGDLVVTGDELPAFTDALQAQGIALTALHKHLPEQSPDVWWTHVCAHGHDAVALACGLRTALDRTGTPAPRPPEPPRPLDLDTAGIDAALGATGNSGEDVHTCVFVRRETIVDEGHVLPPGLGATSAFNFQPLGGGRAVLSGDLAMVATEVQEVLAVLRRGGIELVELHNHGLTDEPRLFFTHIWAQGDAVDLARSVRPAVAATNVVPATT